MIRIWKTVFSLEKRLPKFPSPESARIKKEWSNPHSGPTIALGDVGELETADHPTHTVSALLFSLSNTSSPSAYVIRDPTRDFLMATLYFSIWRYNSFGQSPVISGFHYYQQ